MPTEFSVDTSRRLILTRASGTLTLADITAARRQLCADPAFDRTFNELFDLRDVTEVAISAAEFEGILATRCSHEESGAHSWSRRTRTSTSRMCSAKWRKRMANECSSSGTSTRLKRGSLPGEIRRQPQNTAAVRGLRLIFRFS